MVLQVGMGRDVCVRWNGGMEKGGRGVLVGVLVCPFPNLIWNSLDPTPSHAHKTLSPHHMHMHTHTHTHTSLLQRAPAKAAVYGVYGPSTAPKDAKVVVTVTDKTSGSSYTVDAEINTVHQAQGDANYAGCTECPGPFATWKAFLHPTAAGGDYTITVNCTAGCGGDPKYWGASITNVTFGDVWHCSGQSNMWLPLGNSFHRNDTLKDILTGGKYGNMRGMIGNSGNGNSIVSYVQY